MYSGNPPWKHAHPEDPLYSLIYCNKPELMWKFFNEQKSEGLFSEEFQDLFTNMVEYDAHARLSLADIVGSEWMNEGEDFPKAAEIKEIFRARR
jgi:serine/threonine protein kinase